MRRYMSHFPLCMNDGKHVFVFGSNLAGRHGKGAAKQAVDHWGASYGNGHGPQGEAYAIPTKDRELRVLSRAEIEFGVRSFKDYASKTPNDTFLVTAIGTGLAGYSHSVIAPMFKDAPENCVLPEEWRTYLE